MALTVVNNTYRFLEGTYNSSPTPVEINVETALGFAGNGLNIRSTKNMQLTLNDPGGDKINIRGKDNFKGESVVISRYDLKKVYFFISENSTQTRLFLEGKS